MKEEGKGVVRKKRDEGSGADRQVAKNSSSDSTNDPFRGTTPYIHHHSGDKKPHKGISPKRSRNWQKAGSRRREVDEIVMRGEGGGWEATCNPLTHIRLQSHAPSRHGFLFFYSRHNSGEGRRRCDKDPSAFSSVTQAVNQGPRELLPPPSFH